VVVVDDVRMGCGGTGPVLGGALDAVARLSTPQTPPPAAALEVWFLSGLQPGAAFDVSVLSEDERARAATIGGEHRASFLAAHVLLRRLLSERLGSQPEDIAYGRDPCPRCGSARGRPVLERPSRPLHFSLSRRAGVVLIGIAAVPVGVDIEALPSAPTVAEVAELLHPAEREEILAAPPAIRAEVFARVWTRKEAYLKGVGTGVGHGLDSDYLGTEGREAAPAGWTVIGVPVATGYAAAVAVLDPGARSASG
jgi:4'-phosphopantetheinyl transferase